MLSRHVRVEDFDAEDWIRIGRILSSASEASDGASRHGGLVLLTEGDRVLKALHTVLGRVEPREVGWPAPLAELSERHGARWVLRVSRAGLATFADRFADRLEPRDDFYGQFLKLFAILAELAEDGALDTYPRDLRTVRIPTERVLARSLDVVCPVGKTLLFAAFDDGDVSTCLALHRGPSGIDRIVGPEQVRRDLGLRSGDWRRDARQLARAVELGVGPLALGCFSQTATWMRLLSDPVPGGWAAAAAAGDIEFHPLAPALAIPLGVDVGRAAYVVARDLAARLGVGSFFTGGSPLRPALDRVKDAVQGDLQRVLGFDPLAVLRALLGASPPEQ
jgi:hypothetical protein